MDNLQRLFFTNNYLHTGKRFSQISVGVIITTCLLNQLEINQKCIEVFIELLSQEYYRTVKLIFLEKLLYGANFFK